MALPIFGARIVQSRLIPNLAVEGDAISDTVNSYKDLMTLFITDIEFEEAGVSESVDSFGLLYFAFREIVFFQSKGTIDLYVGEGLEIVGIPEEQQSMKLQIRTVDGVVLYEDLYSTCEVLVGLMALVASVAESLQSIGIDVFRLVARFPPLDLHSDDLPWRTF